MSGPLDIDSTGQPRFHGHDNRECGEHHTVGSHRAWCYDCSEWCYPSNDGACKGCELPALRGEVRQLRQALAVYREHVSEYCGARRLLPSGYTDLCVLPVEHDGPCIFDAALGAAVTPTPQDEETLPGIYDVMRLQAASERAIADIYGPVTSTPTPQETGGETRCSRCGGPNVSWCAPSPLWNEVMRGGSIDGPWQYSEIICPTCFCVLTEAAGVALDWRVDAQTVNVPLQTVTPTGRVWDAENWLWVTSTPEAATEPPKYCDEPVWDGPHKMPCGYRIVKGSCIRHGAPSGLQRGTEQQQ